MIITRIRKIRAILKISGPIYRLYSEYRIHSGILNAIYRLCTSWKLRKCIFAHN